MQVCIQIIERTFANICIQSDLKDIYEMKKESSKK